MTMTNRGLEAVILDPYRPYALLMIERLYERFGIRTVCLHQDWRTRLLLEGRHRQLRSPAVSAHYMVGELGWDRAAQILRTRHHVAGVLPYEEGMVKPLSDLAELLGLSWAQPDVLPVFRDKRALKAMVLSNDPSIRMNAFTHVTTTEEVVAFADARHLRRFVLKPNDGSGNNDVAFFDTPVDPTAVAAYVRRHSGPVLMEEFIEGPEYWVNGQMDSHGEPFVQAVGSYMRIDSNGVRNLEIGSTALPTGDPHFPVLVQYAQDVMRATGLRRSPFHLEAIVDDRGPCLVEVGARLCGDEGVLLDQWQHGLGMELIDMACHYYVSDTPRPTPDLDWTHYDSHVAGTATGTSPDDQRLITVEGLRDVEVSPHFLWWIKRPGPGDHVQKTQSLTSRAWSVALWADSPTGLSDAICWSHRTIALSGTAQPGWTWGQRAPMYRGLAGKVWSSRPRLYEARALLVR
jgi:hypothetical protein